MAERSSRCGVRLQARDAGGEIVLRRALDLLFSTLGVRCMDLALRIYHLVSHFLRLMTKPSLWVAEFCLLGKSTLSVVQRG